MVQQPLWGWILLLWARNQSFTPGRKEANSLWMEQGREDVIAAPKACPSFLCPPGAAAAGTAGMSS